MRNDTNEANHARNEIEKRVPNRTKVPLYTWLTPELDQALRTLAQRRGVAIATIVREALTDVASKYEGERPRDDMPRGLVGGEGMIEGGI